MKVKRSLLRRGFDVGQAAGDEVIDADNLMVAFVESIAEMGTDEASPAGDECTHEYCPRMDGRKPAVCPATIYNIVTCDTTGMMMEKTWFLQEFLLH